MAGWSKGPTPKVKKVKFIPAVRLSKTGKVKISKPRRAGVS